MATRASVANFYGSDLARPYLLPTTEFAGTTKILVTTYNNPNQRVSRPLGPSTVLLEWAESALWKQGGVAKTRKKKMVGSSATKLITSGKLSKPKRPPSAYFLFAAEERAKLVKENPSIASKVTVVAKELGKLWKEITAERKQEFEAQAKELKDEWVERVAEWKGKDGATTDRVVLAKKKGAKKRSSSKDKKKRRKKKKSKVSRSSPKGALHLLGTPAAAKKARRQVQEEVSTPANQVQVETQKKKTPMAPRKKKIQKETKRRSRRTLRMKRMLN
ncbi:HMG box domain-containing protein [Chloropicon primus]|uniref:HMG box domain-containing protein n=1 Tax=Chloropicon primus TaxID=1764295 RepID=A0A5B8MNX6_9CHLO|nr:hypothetical protein A3770_06p42320 [Chloropicon primus]UPR00935.1 HMG box domain-containing protein [Chloropicon primus]|mmetsp:Transcript_14555/g.41514  ORF Transcript_14555/g.41514 Transcript_14555/m.41514 type:complete len:275 (+) Transcript_14555:1152-1976(+)|eukprot:QDZ21714.1 hypothetical protein A3770_06p42320 [Chloropicon primus]